jgi:hypothetical protein
MGRLKRRAGWVMAAIFILAVWAIVILAVRLVSG